MIYNDIRSIPCVAIRPVPRYFYGNYDRPLRTVSVAIDSGIMCPLRI
ncbi:MAG: hypothetical protein Q4G08_09375 [Capnocytophaga sp.]|nr:hypothetical protein [Capnocytophaga sp.]